MGGARRLLRAPPLRRGAGRPARWARCLAGRRARPCVAPLWRLRAGGSSGSGAPSCRAGELGLAAIRGWGLVGLSWAPWGRPGRGGRVCASRVAGAPRAVAEERVRVFGHSPRVEPLGCRSPGSGRTGGPGLWLLPSRCGLRSGGGGEGAAPGAARPRVGRGGEERKVPERPCEQSSPWGRPRFWCSLPPRLRSVVSSGACPSPPGALSWLRGRLDLGLPMKNSLPARSAVQPLGPFEAGGGNRRAVPARRIPHRLSLCCAVDVVLMVALGDLRGLFRNDSVTSLGLVRQPKFVATKGKALSTVHPSSLSYGRTVLCCPQVALCPRGPIPGCCAGLCCQHLSCTTDDFRASLESSNQVNRSGRQPVLHRQCAPTSRLCQSSPLLTDKLTNTLSCGVEEAHYHFCMLCVPVFSRDSY